VLSSQLGHLGGSTTVEWAILVMRLLPRVFMHDLRGECCDVISHIGLELTIFLVRFLRDLGCVLDTMKEIYPQVRDSVSAPSSSHPGPPSILYRTRLLGMPAASGRSRCWYAAIH
jgi:hypothetical protein